MQNITQQLAPRSVYPLDLESAAEAARLTIMSRVMTRHLHALLPPPLRARTSIRVLDIGCGTGGWAHDVAYEYPKGEIVGIDSSELMLALARSGARALYLDNASFERLDASQPLPFADGSFDFVQARFANGFLLQQTWPEAVREWVRVTCSGGYIRLIESDGLGQSTHPAFEHLQRLVGQACLNDPLRRVQPVTPHLARWVHDAGCLQVQEHIHRLNFSAPLEPEDAVHMEIHLSMCQVLEATFSLLKPFLLAHVPLAAEELNQLCEQVTIGMMQADFRGYFSFVEVLGIKPGIAT